MNEAVWTKRIERAQTILQARGLDLLISTSAVNVFYFTGQRIDPHERLLTVLIPAVGEPALIAPVLHRHDFSGTPLRATYLDDAADAGEALSAHLPERGVIAVDPKWPASWLLTLQERFPNGKTVSGGSVFADLRQRKDEAELEMLRQSSALADKVMERLWKRIAAGMTEQEVSDALSALWAEEGIREMAFKPIIGSGVNGANPHHGSSEQPIEEGELLVIDMGGVVNDYVSDMTRTVAVGDVAAKMREVHDIVRRAQEAGVRAVRPGVPMSEIDSAARRVIEEAGYGAWFIHGLGHGVGIDVHEDPYVRSHNHQLAEPGMVFSIEPGIYLPGEFGVRIEDLVIVTEDGVERLNHVDRGLVTVG